MSSLPLEAGARGCGQGLTYFRCRVETWCLRPNGIVTFGSLTWCALSRAAPWYDLGCEGGDFEGGVDYIIDNGGIDTEKEYPYLAHDDKCMCAFNLQI